MIDITDFIARFQACSVSAKKWERIEWSVRAGQ